MTEIKGRKKHSSGAKSVKKPIDNARKMVIAQPPRAESSKSDSKLKRNAKSGLTPKQARFIDEYLIDLNGTQAAIRAGYSKRGADVQAVRLLGYASVMQAIQSGIAKRSERTGINADDALKEAWNILTADANGLVEFRRTCCRHCYGIGHRYQFTAGEMEEARIRHNANILRLQAQAVEVPPESMIFDERGGIGYDKRRPPNPDCPECFGEGVGDVFVKDTRNLPTGVTSLYAGVKTTKEGIEVKMHSKEKALELVGRHLGLWNDKLKLQGDAENPIQTVTKVVKVPEKQVAEILTAKIASQNG